MAPKSLLALVLILLVLGLGGWFLLARNTPAPAARDGQESEQPMETLRTYTSDEYGLSFSYPALYFLIEQDVGTPDAPQHAIILAEDTQENRDLFAGRVTEPREGPPTITIEIHQNPQQLSPEAWIRQSTNWTLSDQRILPVMLNGYSGAAFEWSGLYEGTSTVLTQGQRTYVVSVTRLANSDRIINDYTTLLESLQLR